VVVYSFARFSWAFGNCSLTVVIHQSTQVR
jgi:hypothetical protein